jgi:hypothetical protein
VSYPESEKLWLVRYRPQSALVREVHSPEALEVARQVRRTDTAEAVLVGALMGWQLFNLGWFLGWLLG